MFGFRKSQHSEAFSISNLKHHISPLILISFFAKIKAINYVLFWDRLSQGKNQFDSSLINFDMQMPNIQMTRKYL